MSQKKLLNMENKTKKDIVLSLNSERNKLRFLIVSGKKNSSEYRDLKLKVSILMAFLKNS